MKDFFVPSGSNKKKGLQPEEEGLRLKQNFGQNFIPLFSPSSSLPTHRRGFLAIL
jgi:hypothetical protein